jgi:hypothetical protein
MFALVRFIQVFHESFWLIVCPRTQEKHLSPLRGLMFVLTSPGTYVLGSIIAPLRGCRSADHSISPSVGQPIRPTRRSPGLSISQSADYPIATSPDHARSFDSVRTTSPLFRDRTRGNETGSFTMPATNVPSMEPTTAFLLFVDGPMVTRTSRRRGS